VIFLVENRKGAIELSMSALFALRQAQGRLRACSGHAQGHGTESRRWRDFAFRLSRRVPSG